MRKKSEQDDISIMAMQEEIADLKQQIKEAKEERESALQKVKEMEDKVKTAEGRKPQLTAIEEKVQINLVLTYLLTYLLTTQIQHHQTRPNVHHYTCIGGNEQEIAPRHRHHNHPDGNK